MGSRAVGIGADGARLGGASSAGAEAALRWMTAGGTACGAAGGGPNGPSAGTRASLPDAAGVADGRLGAGSPPSLGLASPARLNLTSPAWLSLTSPAPSGLTSPAAFVLGTATDGSSMSS
jgi:hypothetical protein